MDEKTQKISGKSFRLVRTELGGVTSAALPDSISPVPSDMPRVLSQTADHALYQGTALAGPSKNCENAGL
jgi:hypothetical protein